MDFLTQLWIPILVSAVVVWLASAVIHMATPLHKNDYKALPDEAKAMTGLGGTPPGNYMFPFCTMEQMKDPAMIEKMKKGPTGVVSIWPGQVNMGKNLAMTFLFYVVVGVFVSFVTWVAEPALKDQMAVFSMAMTLAFMAHGLGPLAHSIWFKTAGAKGYLISSVLYGVFTGGVFAWLWPIVKVVA